MIFFYYMFLAFSQAITEFLPISSSGHLLFLKGVFKITDIPLIFDIIVHVASLCAIIIFYQKRITNTLKNGWIELKLKKEKKVNVRFIIYLLISTVVTFLIYLFFKDYIESRFETPSILGYTFLMTSLILFSTYFFRKAGKNVCTDKSYLLPVLVGIFQGLAILPGISRSGATISSLLILKIKREEAAYYSFFLAIPAILGALMFKLFDMENIQFLADNVLLLVISFILSAVFSYIFLRILFFIIHKGKFWIFSMYTLILSVVSFILF